MRGGGTALGGQSMPALCNESTAHVCGGGNHVVGCHWPVTEIAACHVEVARMWLKVIWHLSGVKSSCRGERTFHWRFDVKSTHAVLAFCNINGY